LIFKTDRKPGRKKAKEVVEDTKVGKKVGIHMKLTLDFNWALN